MRVGDYAEHFTTGRARRAVKNLTALAPQTARIERDGEEQELPVAEVHPGDTVIVRPGEQIPVEDWALVPDLVINYTSEVGQRQYEDFGPVLVQTRSFLRFYPVGTYTATPLPVLGYELLRAYPPGTTEDEAVQLSPDYQPSCS
jgi:hypothetical protein